MLSSECYSDERLQEVDIDALYSEQRLVGGRKRSIIVNNGCVFLDH